MREFSIGRVIATTFGIVGRNWLVLLVLALLFSVLPSLIGLAMIKVDRPEDVTFATLPVSLISVLVGAIFQAGTIQVALTDMNGGRAAFGPVVGNALKVALPVIGLTILFVLGLYAGLILLVIPGLMLATAWAVALPALVAERQGVFAAFGRSRALTKGHRWSIFGLFIIVGVATLLVGGFSGVAMLDVVKNGRPVSEFFWSAPFFISQIAGVVTSIVLATGLAALYAELRAVKEGAAPADLAAIFS